MGAEAEILASDALEGGWAGRSSHAPTSREKHAPAQRQEARASKQRAAALEADGASGAGSKIDSKTFMGPIIPLNYHKAKMNTWRFFF